MEMDNQEITIIMHGLGLGLDQLDSDLDSDFDCLDSDLDLDLDSLDSDLDCHILLIE